MIKGNFTYLFSQYYTTRKIDYIGLDMYYVILVIKYTLNLKLQKCMWYKVFLYYALTGRIVHVHSISTNYFVVEFQHR